MSHSNLETNSTICKSSVLNEIPNIQHGFGTMNSPLPASDKIWDKRPHWNQVHGVQCVQLMTSNQNTGNTDGHFTQMVGVPSPVLTADCAPILLTHESGACVASLHAGWRGTYERILFSLFSKLPKLYSNPREWIACIGPCIGTCCYEVSQDLAKQFTNAFGESVCKVFDGHPHLSIATANLIQLHTLGVQRTATLSECTYCKTQNENFKFYSHRRDTHQNIIEAKNEEKIEEKNASQHTGQPTGQLAQPPRRRQWSAIWISNSN